MAELVRTTVAAELGAADPAIEAPGFALRVLDPARMWLITGGAELAANEATLGDPCRLWLAPGRVLLVSDTADAPAEGAFATDVTDGFAVFALSGERLHDILAMGCTLDPRSDTLAPGRCAQTLFGGARVLLQPRGDMVRLYVERPLAAFLLEWLRRSASALNG